MDQQPPFVRDFFGLGNLVADDHEGLEKDAQPPFVSIHGLPAPSTHMDFGGVKHSMLNFGLSMEHNFPFKKASEEVCKEGSAESYGRQWQGIVPGTNTTSGKLPTRALPSDVNAKANGMPLTIFYGGQVNVYNNVDSDKAQALMNMASNDSVLPLNALTLQLGMSHALGAQGFCQPAAGLPENFAFNNAQAVPVQFTADQASENHPATNKQFEGVMPETPSSASSPQPVVPRALPLARKASLARFLEKRKERMQMMMPYYKKQLAMAQGPSTGDQMVGPFQGATLAKLYEEYYRRPSPMVFAMPEHMLPHKDIASCGIPAKE